MKSLPDGLANEWKRFLETKPSVQAQADWCMVKSAEHGWDFFDLSLALGAGVQKPHLPELDKGGSGPLN